VSSTQTSPAPQAADRLPDRPTRWGRGAVLALVSAVVLILSLLLGVSWWTLLPAGANWPQPVTNVGTLAFAAAFVAFPVLMVLGHRGGDADWAARIADTLLGAMWVLFTWSLVGNGVRLGLLAAGVGDPVRSRVVALGVLSVSALLLAWGHVEAMRVPRVRSVEVSIPGLGAGLDGARLVLLTDTHYGPIDRAGWSAQVVEKVNDLRPDIVCHTGDIADGTVEQRSDQVAPLGSVRASLARAYVTGNHEYFGGSAQEWLDHMRHLGWQDLHNRHIVVERGGDRLVLAGVDDRIAGTAGAPGHGADHATALAGTDPRLPVILLAHQPKQIGAAVEHGVDLQLSGHTHGGQIWPFHYLVRLDQPAVWGLSRHGERTQLYTSRGAGFWGPPFRVFAPSEITLVILRSAASPATYPSGNSSNSTAADSGDRVSNR